MRAWDGKQVVMRMERKSLHAQDIADAVGVTKRVVSNWRQGVEPRAERLVKLAAVLGCSPDDFYSEVKG